MSRKVIILCGSPHKEGNTNTVAGWVAQGARGKGAEVEVIDAVALKYKVGGCVGCMGCQSSKEFRCVIDDEAGPIIARLPEADVLAFATPVYFYGPTAHLKRFIDRMFSLFKFSPDGKVRQAFHKTRVALIATAAGGLDDGLSLTEQLFRKIAAFSGKEMQSLLVPNAEGADKEELRRKAVAFGESLARV